MDTLPPRVSSFFVLPPSLCLVGLLLFVALLNGQRDLTAEAVKPRETRST